MNAFVPTFKNDIFISYARVDNHHVANGLKVGWVDRFHVRLQALLDTRAGVAGRVKIWRDVKRLGLMQLFDAEIRKQVEGSAIFVALTSRGYHESKFCRPELTHFHAEATRQDLLRIDNTYRIVDVRLCNIPPDDRLDELSGTTGFDFHNAPPNADPWAGYPLNETDPDYTPFIERLADELYKTLEEFSKVIVADPPDPPDDPPPPPETPPGATEVQEGKFQLYLADVADTLQKLQRRVREKIEAQYSDVNVSQLQTLPPDATNHSAEVLKKLKTARLAVHLLDEVPGRYIEAGVSVTYPQQEAELSKRNARAQLVWVPDTLSLCNIEDSDHAALIRGLEEIANEEITANTDSSRPPKHMFVRSAEEHLAVEILQRIDDIRRNDEQLKPTAPYSVLLDAHAKDTNAAHEIGAYLERQRIQVSVITHPDERSALSIYEETMKRVNAVLVVYGNAQESWVIGRYHCALKMYVDGKSAIKVIGIFLAPPEKPDAEEIFTYGPTRPNLIIDHMHSTDLDEDKLSPLVGPPTIDNGPA